MLLTQDVAANEENRRCRRALRMLAAEQDTQLNALAIEAFNDLLAKHGKRRVVENPLLND